MLEDRDSDFRRPPFEDPVVFFKPAGKPTGFKTFPQNIETPQLKDAWKGPERNESHFSAKFLSMDLHRLCSFE
jgi:hypothetical protein